MEDQNNFARNQYDGQYILCDECDLVVEVPRITNQHNALCPRCDNRLVSYRKQTNQLALVYAVCALVMFILACAFYLVNISIIGNITNMDLFLIPRMLINDDYTSLAFLFITFVLVLPITSLVILIILCCHQYLPNWLKINLLIGLGRLQHWCMAEIFLAGLIVSFVKLISYGDIGLNLSFLPFCLFALMQIKALSLFSTRQVWQSISPAIHINTPFVVGKSGLSQNIRSCHCCKAILPVNKLICPRCQIKGSARYNDSIQWTMALLLTSTILYIPANTYPIMSTVFVGGISGSTVLDGVSYMWKSGDYPVAAVIFIASIIIPIFKIIALCWLCYYATYVNKPTEKASNKMNKIYNVVEFIGRWSMIDIFVVSVTATLVNNGEMIAVYPAAGAVFFAIVVIITMIASHKYDPRLIWDKVKNNE